ncbi:MAG TPA: DUF4270 domain-containing protein [Flavobacterium sp.]|jgi:hypothetical protein
MNRTSFFKTLLFSITTLFLVSCDKDFSELGADIIGDDHFDLVPEYDSKVVANNISTGPVQSNNLEVNPLGVYSDPVFGTTTANFVTQLELGTENPTFTNLGTAPTVESVLLSVPYYSTYLSTDTDGVKFYELDSIYGTPGSNMKLSVYRNRYFLQNIDHDLEGNQQQQRYYTDQDADFSSLIQPGDLLNDSSIDSENEQFFFGSEEVSNEYYDSHDDLITEKLPPGMYLKLNKDKFQEWILEAPAGQLLNNNIFKDYFRGLYFKTEQNNGQDGQLAMLNFRAGKITIRYKEDNQAPDGTVTQVRKVLVLTMSGNSVSLVTTQEKPAYTAAINQPIQPDGASRIYLKGGQGSVAAIDLFGPDLNTDEIPDQLQTLRDHVKYDGWQINEANLTFYVADEMAGIDPKHQPLRLYLYDIKNKTPLIDYFFDNTNGGDETQRKVIHSGVKGRTNDKTYYKIRMTNYMRALAGDSTNVKLGVSVSRSINFASMAKLKNANTILNDYIPTASVYHQLGTVLYGSNIPEGDDNYDYRLKLEIYYTKPN